MKLKKLFLLLIFLLLISCSKKIENTYSSNLRIIHMNDHHSHLDYTKVKLKLNDKPILIDIGGIALDTTVIKGLKKEAEENSTPVLVLHAGDAEQGTIYYTLFKGESDAKLMNEIGFDAMAIGNHEFDDGDEHLAGFIRMLNMPALSANILPSKFSPLIDKIDSIKLYKSNKMAIIGLTVVKKTLDSSNPGKNIKFKDEFSSVQDIANALNNMGIEKIILLSHQGYKTDIEMASRFKHIDIIVGGDSHSLLGDFNDLGLVSEGDYPTIVNDSEGNRVCVVQAWEFAKAVGVLDTVFDKQGNVLSCKGNTIIPVSENIDNSIKRVLKTNKHIEVVKKDKKTAEIIDSYKKLIGDKLNKVIGRAYEDIINVRIPNTKYNSIKMIHGSDLAPIISKSYYESVNNADIVIQNAGGIRKSILKGDIKISQIYEILPYSNTLFEYRLKGKQIIKLLEDSIKYAVISPASSGGFPYPYGIRFDIDLNAKPIITNVEVLNRKTSNWGKINKEKFYNVVTHSYLATGKNGYAVFKEHKGNNLYLDYAEIFVKYIEKLNMQGIGLTKLNINELPIKTYIPLDNAK